MKLGVREIFGKVTEVSPTKRNIKSNCKCIRPHWNITTDNNQIKTTISRNMFAKH